MQRVPTRMSGVALVLACLLALVVPTHAQAKDCRGADAKPRGAKAVRATLCLLNVERKKAGLKALKADNKLRHAARAHSVDMVASGYFDHDSPLGSTLVARIRAAGYLKGARTFSVSENLGWGSGSLGTPRGIVAAWLQSAGHRANLLAADMRDAGVGIADGSPSGGAGATYTVAFGVRT